MLEVYAESIAITSIDRFRYKLGKKIGLIGGKGLPHCTLRWQVSLGSAVVPSIQGWAVVILGLFVNNVV